MRTTLMIVLGALTFGAGCADTTAIETELAELKRRVAVLEKSGPAKGAKAGKAGKARKAKAGKGEKAKAGKGEKAKTGKTKGEKAPVGPKGTVELSGDATKVTLDDGRRTYPIPGAVPVGLYTIKAAFAGDAALAKMATVEVQDGVTTAILCDSVARTCAPN
jgi:hypothetical protein